MPLSLKHSPARVMAQLLADIGLGAEPMRGGDNQPNWGAFWDNEPPRPNNVLTCADTVGITFDGDAHGGRNEHFGVQIRVRGGTQDVAWNKAQEVATALDALRPNLPQVVAVQNTNETVATNYCVGQIYRKGQPARMGPPSAGSSLRAYTINLLVAMSQQT